MPEPIFAAIERLDRWIEQSDWVGYDAFDGLSSPLLRPFTFEVPILRIALQQGVRRLPVNGLRPLLGITKKHSTKAMGYFAKGYLRLYQMTQQRDYLEKAIYCLLDLQENYSRGYTGYAWGNAFDYQARGGYVPKDVPTVVWTSFIGYAFVDAYEFLQDKRYLDVARSACDLILNDLTRGQVTEDSLCISYFPHMHTEIHNANILAASLLARVYQHTGEAPLLDLARRAVKYTMDHQRADGSWYYGEGFRWHWVDGYHTGFVLDALYWYRQGSGDHQYDSHLRRGMDYYRQQLFEGILPKHYVNETYPIDIQVVAQAIQSFALIPEADGGNLDWSEQVARWAIANMQDASGYFYFRKHHFTMNRTACLHWGQATMLAALTLLEQRRRHSTYQAEPGPVAIIEKAGKIE